MTPTPARTRVISRTRYPANGSAVSADCETEDWRRMKSEDTLLLLTQSRVPRPARHKVRLIGIMAGLHNTHSLTQNPIPAPESSKKKDPRSIYLSSPAPSSLAPYLALVIVVGGVSEDCEIDAEDSASKYRGVTRLNRLHRPLLSTIFAPKRPERGRQGWRVCISEVHFQTSAHRRVLTNTQ